MFGTFLVPIGLFYQAWTSFPSLPPWPCLSAGILFGAGILTCFISSYQYIIDVYQVSKKRPSSFPCAAASPLLTRVYSAGWLGDCSGLLDLYPIHSLGRCRHVHS